MIKVAVPIETVTIAHVVRPLEIAKVLRRQGVEVIFGCHERYQGLIRDEGFEVRPLYAQDPETLFKEVRDYSFRTYRSTLEKCLAADLDFLRGFNPSDVVLSDLRWTSKIAAAHLGNPHISVVNGYFSPYYDVLPEIPENFSRYLPRAVKRHKGLRQFFKSTVPRFYYHRFLSGLYAKYGVRPASRRFFDVVMGQDLTLICDLPEFTPQKNLPAAYRFVGPILWEPERGFSEIPGEFDGKRKPLVYVTLGTSGTDGMLTHIIEFFKRHPEYDVVISTGKLSCGPLPGHMIAAPFVKASQVLGKARLVICHSGNGSIYQALAHGVPLLCFTTFYDQEWNGQRVRELGLGNAVFHTRMSQKRLQKFIEDTVGNPGFKKNAARISEEMKKWNGAELAAEQILDFVLARQKGKIAS